MHLHGWKENNMTRFEIDHTVVINDISDFPLLVRLTNDNAEHLFDELSYTNSSMFDSNNKFLNPNRKKIAVTTEKSATECYVDIETWDDFNREILLWVKVPLIKSYENTILCIYYDSTHDDNIEYISDSGSKLSNKVWNTYRIAGGIKL